MFFLNNNRTLGKGQMQDIKVDSHIKKKSKTDKEEEEENKNKIIVKFNYLMCQFLNSFNTKMCVTKSK